MILFYSFNFVPKLHCIVYNTCHSPSKTNKHNFINHAISFPYRDGFWHHLNWSMYKDLWDCGKGNHVYEQAIAVSNITHKLLHDSVLFGGEYKLWFERCLHLNFSDNKLQLQNQSPLFPFQNLCLEDETHMYESVIPSGLIMGMGHYFF